MLRCGMTAHVQPPQLSPTRNAALFKPRSVALFAEEGRRDAEVIAQNMGAGGFSGSMYASGVSAPGLEAVASIADLPAAPDLAVLCLSGPALADAMAALARRGCRAAVVPGPAPDLAEISARTGVRALGPNSFGLCVPGIGLNASLAHLRPSPGRLALLSQSAATTRAVLDWAAAEGLGFSHVVGIGGNASVGFATALDWIARDPETGAVLLDLRRIRNRRAFVSAARAVARTRPVVALRAGARGSDASGIGVAVMDAALRRAGVLRVSGLEDLLAAAETLARVRSVRAGDLRHGDRVALISNGIGLGRIAADALAAGGGRLAELSPAAHACLQAHLPDAASATNPLSLGPMSGTRLAEAAACLAAVPEVDAVVALHAPTPHGDDAAAAEAMIAAASVRRGRAAPVLVAWTGQETAGPQRDAMTRAGLAVFATPEAAVRGALHLAQDRRNRAAAAELPPRDVLELKPDRELVRRIMDGAAADKRLALDQEEALALLAAYGLPVAPGRRAAGPADAADAAAMLRFPVALKIISPDLQHKSEVGGVALGLETPRAVLEAAEAMLGRMRALRPDAAVRGFLVQRQASRGLELRLRLGDDPMFGPWIGFGQGGTAADIAGDEAHDLPPLNLALASQMVGRSRTAKLLAGFRDWPPANRAAVAEALVRLSQIAVDWPEIAECTINPLVADARGVLALDASITLRPAGEKGTLAIPPYPAELARQFTAPTGEAITVRPIRPEDAAAHAEAFRRVPPADIRWRFFSPIRELSPALVARLVQIDYDREMAFVAVRDATRETVGVARLIREPNDDEAEFAIILAKEVKGWGLGRFLMERLFDWARDNGVRKIVGQILADNAPMLAFARRLGFDVRRSPAEEGVMVAEREVVA